MSQDPLSPDRAEDVKVELARVASRIDPDGEGGERARKPLQRIIRAKSFIPTDRKSVV